MLNRSAVSGCLALVAAFLVGGNGACGQSTATGINLSRTANDIYVGDDLTFTAVRTGSHPIQNVKWKYWAGDLNASPGEASGGTSLSWNGAGRLPVVCDYAIQVEITFLNYPSGGTYISTSPKVTWTAKPPEEAFLVTQLPVSGPRIEPGNGPTVFLNFKIRGNGRNLYIQGTIKEKVTRVPRYGASDTDYNEQPFLNMIGPGEFRDGKGISCDLASWNAIPNPSTVDSVSVSYAISMLDKDLNEVLYVLQPAQPFVVTKFATMWTGTAQ